MLVLSSIKSVSQKNKNKCIHYIRKKKLKNRKSANFRHFQKSWKFRWNCFFFNFLKIDSAQTLEKIQKNHKNILLVSTIDCKKKTKSWFWKNLKIFHRKFHDFWKCRKFSDFRFFRIFRTSKKYFFFRIFFSTKSKNHDFIIFLKRNLEVIRADLHVQMYDLLILDQKSWFWIKFFFFFFCLENPLFFSSFYFSKSSGYSSSSMYGVVNTLLGIITHIMGTSMPPSLYTLL